MKRMKRHGLIRLNGKLYKEQFLREPVPRDLEMDFYNLAFAAICQLKKEAKKRERRLG